MELPNRSSMGWTWDQWDGFATVPVAARWSTSRQAYKLDRLQAVVV